MYCGQCWNEGKYKDLFDACNPFFMSVVSDLAWLYPTSAQSKAVASPESPAQQGPEPYATVNVLPEQPEREATPTAYTAGGEIRTTLPVSSYTEFPPAQASAHFVYGD